LSRYEQSKNQEVHYITANTS